MSAPIDPDKFVAAWLEAHSKGKGIAYVANVMQDSPSRMAAKAQTLRKKGVPLPSLQAGRHLPDYPSLIRLVENYNKKNRKE